MIGKRFVIASLLAAVSLASVAIFLWGFALPPQTYAPIRIEEVRIVQIGWNVPLARAEFNLTVDAYPPRLVCLDHVEVNGIRVDAYPQTLAMAPRESVVIKVYYNYAYDSKYEFSFVTEEGNEFTYVSESPPECALQAAVDAPFIAIEVARLK